ncbi:FecR domain-containing protein [uncultured Draconibacterium sp.]|uniref:FecR family protein n=1 Tax=uncultured Draconibacterium sp. TaxID=1573823 RepID=UPI002AA6B254|nr:FecR domain-containing protein [uncultured Draconibacterium sp.]
MKNASVEEEGKIKDWLDEDVRHKELFEELRDEQQLVSELEKLDEYNEVSSWKLLQQRIENKRQRIILFRWKVIAVIFLILGIGGVTSNYLRSSVEEIVPQTFLTTIQTKRGESSTVILPDSSVVHLNSATSLTYSNNFFSTNRTVDLKGEAYFEVAKSTTHPFEVSCESVKVKVYGTSFNVNTYSTENSLDVILEEGSVELSHKAKRFENVMLVPGEKASFDEVNNELRIIKVDTYKYTAWREGLLVFEDDSMDAVFKKLESWYDIDIEITDKNINEFVFNATIMDESLEDIFDLIQFSCGIKYNIIYSKNPKIISKVIVSLN